MHQEMFPKSHSNISELSRNDNQRKFKPTESSCKKAHFFSKSADWRDTNREERFS